MHTLLLRLAATLSQSPLTSGFLANSFIARGCGAADGGVRTRAGVPASLRCAAGLVLLAACCL
jgi:hypothetical protein